MIDLHPTIAAFIFSLLCLYPTYKTFQKAGLKTPYAFLILIPYLGLFVVTAILAHSTWTTVPPLKTKKDKA